MGNCSSVLSGLFCFSWSWQTAQAMQRWDLTELH
jgi:hypothetical protein